MRSVKQVGIASALSLMALGLTTSHPFVGWFAPTATLKVTPHIPVNLPPPELLGQGARPPTAEELAAEKAFDTQRIQQAAMWLKSPDIHQRLIGVQQLNAYQYPAAENLLIQVLRQDLDPAVRTGAAQSLGMFKQLGESSLQALLAALTDKHTPTAMAAMDTLLIYASRINFDTQAFPKLLEKLTQRLKAGHLDKRVKRGLEVFIVDQQTVVSPR